MSWVTHIELKLQRSIKASNIQSKTITILSLSWGRFIRPIHVIKYRLGRGLRPFKSYQCRQIDHSVSHRKSFKKGHSEIQEEELRH